jgi:hypothetical protein
MYRRQKFTKEQEEKILSLFYRTKLDRCEVIINNTTTYIAKKLNMKVQLVNSCLDSHLDYKFKKIAERLI